MADNQDDQSEQNVAPKIIKQQKNNFYEDIKMWTAILALPVIISIIIISGQIFEVLTGTPRT